MDNSTEKKPGFRDPKNVAIALLVLIVLIMGGLLVQDNLTV